jgi:putative ABC transport system permease protein
MMHIDDATRAINRRLAVPIKDQINVVLVEAKTSDVNAEAQQAVQNLIPKGVATGFLCYSPAAKITRVTEIAVWLLSIVVGGASILLSMRSQSASVIERQREIGIFKAVGWTDGNIVSLIVAESVLQAIAGGCFGFLLGTAVLAIIPFGGLIKQLLFVETVFPKSWAPITLSLLHASMIWVLIILGGIAGGILAAVPAVRLRPADALRRI